MAPPKLSIVIPTRNRQRYCMAAIDDILSHPRPDTELCIHDNSDDDDIARHIEAHHKKDKRLKYTRVPEQLNSVENMDRAVGMAKGKYICMLGDDDTVLPGLFEMLDWMEREGVDSVAPMKHIDYYWPGAYGEGSQGVLLMPTFSGVRRRVDTGQQLWQLFRNGTVFYMNYHLPRIYHGIVLRGHMEEIRRRTGHYFGGLTPDLYSTVALSAVVSNHHVVDVPMTVSGVCPTSASSLAKRGIDRGELHTAPHLHLREDYVWDPIVPAYNSGSTLWAVSALKAVEEMGIPRLREQFNFPRFAAFVLIDDRVIGRLVLRKLWECRHQAMRNSPAAVAATLAALCWRVGRAVPRRLWRMVARKKTATRIAGVNDVAHASRIIQTTI